MNKLLLFVLTIFFSLGAFSQEVEHLRTIVKIEKKAGGTKVYSSEKGDYIPTVVPSKEVKETLASLANGSEAVVEGHITYEVISDDTTRRLRPFFVIEAIHPVSLSELGSKVEYMPEPQLTFKSEIERPLHLAPSVPVTTEVASAITLTYSLLLMESLASGSGDPEGRRDLTQALIISAGTMATLLFLYEQVTGKTKP